MTKLASKPCEYCGGEIKLTKHMGIQVFTGRKYCSRKCYSDSLIKPASECTTATLGWRARKFMGGSCEFCGDTEKLCVHHHNKDCADNSPENIMTLCRGCHGRIHYALDGMPHGVRTRCKYCGEPAYKAKELCGKHYKRSKKHGDALKVRKYIDGAWRVVKEEAICLN